MFKYLAPLIVFLVLAAFLAVGLKSDPRLVPSPLIEKPAPAFSANELMNENTQLTLDSFKGEAFLLNVWASWCAACQVEHPLINQLAQNGTVKVVGLNYKDKAADAQQWLQRLGNPYSAILHDLKGDIGIDYGVYGVPESFLIDKNGVIRYKQIGPFTADSIRDELLPALALLEAS